MIRTLVLVMFVVGLVGCAKKETSEAVPTDDVEAECKALGLAVCEAKGAELLKEGADLKDDPGVPYLQHACDQGGVTACTRLGQVLIGRGMGDWGIRILERACDKGHGDACRWAGEAYQAGVGGTPKDGTKAVGAYERGCRAKDQAACFNRGAFYMTGRGGTEKDLAKGLELMTSACKAGYTKGCGILRKNGMDPDGPRRAAPAARATTKRLAGIRWVMSGRLADRLQIKKVRCQEPFRDKKMCHMTLKTTAPFGKREMVWATVYDADGAQTGHYMVSTPERPGTIKQRIRVGVDTKRVEFDF